MDTITLIGLSMVMVLICGSAGAEEQSPFFTMDSAVVEKAIFDVMRPVDVINITGGWNIRGMHFNSTIKERADNFKTWGYEEKGKKISFMHQKTAWNTGLVIAAGTFPVTGEINRESIPVEVFYDDAIRKGLAGKGGINVKIIQDNYRWQKIIEIESLESLGKIPITAEYLEISFLIFDDFDVPNGIIEKPILFGENSYLQPIKVWDSSKDPDDKSGVYGVISGAVVTKKIPIAWLKDAVYPVQTDLTITYGTENVFNSATTDYISVASLDNTHFVVAYRDGVFGTARVGVVSGTTISSYGAENVFNAADTRVISVTSLDSTHFVIAYADVGNSWYGTAIIGEVSGTTISSYGAENVFNAAAATYISTASLSSTHFIIAYKDGGNSNYGTAIIGEVSGTTISSYGAENVFNAADTYSPYFSVAALDSTHFVVAYKDGGNSNYGTAIIGEVSGTTISSYGAENVFNSASTAEIFIAPLNSTHFVIAYQNGAPSYYGNAIVGVVSGTTISSYGAENMFNSVNSNIISVATFNNTCFVVVYKDDGGDDYGCARVGLVSGSTISSYGAENVFNSAITNYISVATLNTTHFVVTYQDVGSSSYGTAILGKTVDIELIYTPPDPLTLANTTGNFWVNHTWAAGSGNVTDSYNVTINSVWHNGTDTFYNDTYAVHAWQNITVWAYNSTGTGTLSSGSISQDTQIPNNAITITNTSDWTGNAGEVVYVDYDATDADSDTATFSCNRMDLFLDFDTSTGTGNWTATANIYYVDFGVSDGYGSSSNYTMTLIESSVEITLLEELKLIMSEITTELKSINMGNYLVYAFILIGILLIIFLIRILNNCIYGK